ncbi:hypothetical protein BKA82DRAFT_4206456 [Pisolithus tinctorius]|nr:hypothetical protein BKA82DRAFT_4206456 [Pisolithus tinctorius]
MVLICTQLFLVATCSTPLGRSRMPGGASLFPQPAIMSASRESMTHDRARSTGETFYRIPPVNFFSSRFKSSAGKQPVLSSWRIASVDHMQQQVIIWQVMMHQTCLTSILLAASREVRETFVYDALEAFQVAHDPQLTIHSSLLQRATSRTATHGQPVFMRRSFPTSALSQDLQRSRRTTTRIL